MKTVSFLLAAMLMTGCASLPRVQPASKAKPADVLAYYQLPDTKIIVDVPITKMTQAVRSCFHTFRVVDTDQASIIGSETVSDNLYAILGNKNPLTDVSFQLTYGKDYTLNSSKADITNRTAEYGVALLKAAAAAAPIFLLSGNIEDLQPSPKAGDNKQISKCKRWRDKINKYIVAPIDESIINCLSGNAPGAATDNLDVLKYRVEQLTKEKNERIRNTLGILSFSITYSKAPDKPFIKEVIGYIDKAHLTYAELKKEERLPYGEKDTVPEDPNRYPVVVTIKRYDADFSAKLWDKISGQQGTQPARDALTPVSSDAQGEPLRVLVSDADKHSYYYRIAGQARVTVEFVGLKIPDAASGKSDNVTIGKIVPVAQYGFITALPQQSHGTTATGGITLVEETGALKTLELGYKTMSPTLVTDAATAAAGIAKSVQDSELNRLQRKREMLEEKVKIKEAQGSLAPGN